jgi:hypothetical protein
MTGPVRTAVIATATVGMLAAGAGAFALTSSASPAQSAATSTTKVLKACVKYGTNTWVYDWNGAGCPSGSYQVSWNQTGPQGPAGAAGATGSTGPAGSQGPAGPAGTYTPVTATATTAISNDADSGNHGNWAVDTLTRSMTVTRHGATAVSNCGGTATNGITSCYYYTAAMTDSGSFMTDSGAKSPNAGASISGVLSGSISGGSNYEFYATSGAPSAATVPATLDATSGSGSSTWPEHFFPSGTAFGGMNEINWVYTYTAPTTCEKWVDAYNNGDGVGAGDGDIAGINACTTSSPKAG